MYANLNVSTDTCWFHRMVRWWEVLPNYTIPESISLDLSHEKRRDVGHNAGIVLEFFLSYSRVFCQEKRRLPNFGELPLSTSSCAHIEFSTSRDKP